MTIPRTICQNPECKSKPISEIPHDMWGYYPHVEGRFEYSGGHYRVHFRCLSSKGPEQWSVGAEFPKDATDDDVEAAKVRVRDSVRKTVEENEIYLIVWQASIIHDFELAKWAVKHGWVKPEKDEPWRQESAENERALTLNRIWNQFLNERKLTKHYERDNAPPNGVFT
jgi:hypothetical protein